MNSLCTRVGCLHDFPVVLGAKGPAFYDAVLRERQRGNYDFISHILITRSHLLSRSYYGIYGNLINVFLS